MCSHGNLVGRIMTKDLAIMESLVAKVKDCTVVEICGSDYG
jgi:hypothetical protein